MAMELLKALSERALPLTITDPVEVDQIRALRAADAVAAMLSPPGCKTPFARVLAITKEGRALMALETHQRSKSG